MPTSRSNTEPAKEEPMAASSDGADIPNDPPARQGLIYSGGAIHSRLNKEKLWQRHLIQ